jgi:hypothetical protein
LCCLDLAKKYSKLQKEEDSEDEADKVVEGETEDAVIDDAEQKEEEDPVPMEIMPQVATPLKPTMSRLATTTSYKYKQDEWKWQPRFQSTKFVDNGFYREELIIVPPISFKGREGSFKVSFEENDSVFVLKLEPPPGIGNPFAIRSYYSQVIGMNIPTGSSWRDAFEDSSELIGRDKWYTFRHKLDWPGKPSNDMGNLKWLQFPEIGIGGQSTKLLIINLSSITPKRVEREDIGDTLQGALFSPNYTTPLNKSSVDMAKAAEMARMKETIMHLAQNGVTFEMMPTEMQKAAIDLGLYGPNKDPSAAGGGGGKRGRTS